MDDVTIKIPESHSHGTEDHIVMTQAEQDLREVALKLLDMVERLNEKIYDQIVRALLPYKAIPPEEITSLRRAIELVGPRSPEEE
jgi:hypothetical protein